MAMARAHGIVILVTDDDMQDRDAGHPRSTRVGDSDGNVVVLTLLSVKCY